MPANVDVPVGDTGTTVIDCSGDAPVNLHNASDEILLLLLGASDARLLAVGATLRQIPAGAAVTASHGGTGDKVLTVQRSIFG